MPKDTVKILQHGVCVDIQVNGLMDYRKVCKSVEEAIETKKEWEANFPVGYPGIYSK